MIIDTAWNTTAHLSQLKDAGVSTIIRYYNHSNSQILPQKRLELAEAEAIRRSGIGRAVVFQQRQNAAVDFTASKGRAACGRAVSLAANIGQPSGSAIYFAVDNDFVSAQNLLAVRHFFKAIRDEMQEQQSRYRVGGYGSGKVLQNLLDHRLIDLCWLAQSIGWSGYQAFKTSGRWNLLQERSTRVAGLDCDTNAAAAGGFGEF